MPFTPPSPTDAHLTKQDEAKGEVVWRNVDFEFFGFFAFCSFFGGFFRVVFLGRHMTYKANS